MRFTLFLIALLATLIAGSQLMGDQQESRLEALFTEADGTRCSPDCLLGIRPGMNYVDAVALLKNLPLLNNVVVDDYGWFQATGEGILKGMRIAVNLSHEQDKITAIQVADESQIPASFPYLSFKEAVVTLGHELYVWGNQPNGRYFYFRDTHISMFADFDEKQRELLRQGMDIPVNEVVIGVNDPYLTGGVGWCGIRDCHYDSGPSHYRN